MRRHSFYFPLSGWRILFAGVNGAGNCIKGVNGARDADGNAGSTDVSAGGFVKGAFADSVAGTAVSVANDASFPVESLALLVSVTW